MGRLEKKPLKCKQMWNQISIDCQTSSKHARRLCFSMSLRKTTNQEIQIFCRESILSSSFTAKWLWCLFSCDEKGWQNTCQRNIYEENFTALLCPFFFLWQCINITFNLPFLPLGLTIVKFQIICQTHQSLQRSKKGEKIP